MPKCPMCKEEVDELTVVSVNGKSKKVCDDCAELLEEKAAVAEASESAVQNLMEFKGRR